MNTKEILAELIARVEILENCLANVSTQEYDDTRNSKVKDFWIKNHNLLDKKKKEVLKTLDLNDHNDS